MITTLIVYVDDIVAIGDDLEEIKKLKKKLLNEFKIKDLGRLKYFLGIKVAHSKGGIVISQQKCTLDLLKETWMLGSRPVDTLIDLNYKLDGEKEDMSMDRERD